YSHFNLDKDRAPYEDSSFDCVIFCEILEHLLLSADFPFSEIHRILKPAGYMILSTPNASRLANLAKLVKGKNIYEDYSPHGIYGRHNREYTLAEIQQLCRSHSLTIVQSKVQNIYPHSLTSRILQRL